VNIKMDGYAKRGVLESASVSNLLSACVARSRDKVGAYREYNGLSQGAPRVQLDCLGSSGGTTMIATQGATRR